MKILDFRNKRKTEYSGEKAGISKAKKRVIVQAALAAFTVILTVVVLFVGSAAWYTNTVQTAGLQFEAAEWGFDGNILIGDQVFAEEGTDLGEQTPIEASPGESGTIALKVTNNSDNLAAVSVGVSKLNLDMEMQKRMYFYIDSPINRNGETVAREYLSETEAHTYVVFGNNGDLILTEEVYSDAPLKWEWVYDVLGYYVRGTYNEDTKTMEISEYLRPIEYDYDKATFSLMPGEGDEITYYVMETVDGTITVEQFIEEFSEHDGYAGKIDPKDINELGYYPVEVDEFGRGIWAYLCTYSEIEENNNTDTSYGEAAKEGTGKKYPVKITVLAQKSRFNTAVASTASDLVAKLDNGEYDVIRLESDITLTTPLKIKSMRDIILDLNGKTISIASADAAIELEGGSSLVVQNGTIDGLLVDNTTMADNAFKVTGAELTLGNVVINNVKSAVTVAGINYLDSSIRIISCNDITTSGEAIRFVKGESAATGLSSLYVENSTIISTDDYAVNGAGMNIQLINSALKGTDSAVYYTQADGKLTLTGCTITGQEYGMKLTGGNVLILDTKITTTDKEASVFLNPSEADSVRLVVDLESSLPELVKAADNGTLGQETDEETKRTTYWVVLNEEIQN